MLDFASRCGLTILANPPTPVQAPIMVRSSNHERERKSCGQVSQDAPLASHVQYIKPSVFPLPVRQKKNKQRSKHKILLYLPVLLSLISIQVIDQPWLCNLQLFPASNPPIAHHSSSSNTPPPRSPSSGQQSYRVTLF